MITRIEKPIEGFKPIIRYRKTSVYHFLYDKEETDRETIECTDSVVVVKNATYEKMVDACIAVKYDISAQLALLYNYQQDAEKYAEEMAVYQEWRTYCKDACRSFFNVNE